MPATLRKLVERLRAHHGEPPAPDVTDPFQQILFEQVAYLATDAKRRAAFQLLKSRVGLRPQQIVQATDETLAEVAASGGGTAVTQRAERMRESAERVLRQWDGDLTRALQLPYAEASRELARFPMIGKPGAGKILLLAGASNRLALESNGLRVLLRIGYGTEHQYYDQTYRSVLEAVAAQPALDQATAAAAHLLLREHGKTICRNSSPACHQCPLADVCRYAQPQRPTSRGPA